jgi:transcriptional regulator with XRE-family HTH domain
MKRQPFILPAARNVLAELGENLKKARLRRRMSAEQVAQRADISRSTLWMIEKGSAAVAMGAYLQVLVVLGLEKDLLRVAADDALGMKLQELNLTTRKRAPKKSAT